jgi:hypothetical protein
VEEFKALARETYAKLAPFGTIDVKLMDRDWATYMTKRVRDPLPPLDKRRHRHPLGT